MTAENNRPQFSVCILEEQTQLTLDDLCHACAIQEQQIFELVEIGVLTPEGSEPARWRFGGASLLRTRRAMRLQRDLDIDLAGAALALDLLDEIELLRTRLRSMGGEH